MEEAGGLIALVVGIAVVCAVLWLIGTAIYAYVMAMGFIVVTAGPLLLVGGSAVVSLAVLGNYLSAFWTHVVEGGGIPDVSAGPEPAIKAYFFGRWWGDYCRVVEASNHETQSVLRTCLQKAHFLLGGKSSTPSSSAPSPDKTPGWVAFSWPFGLLLFLVAGVGGLVALVATAVFGVLHLAVALAAVLLALLAAGFFYALEALSMAARRIFLACPHGGCYQRIGLPVYQCPGCGAEHRRLTPGTYGTFERRCQCGRHLPTLFLFGRNSLPSYCPKCSGPLTFTLVRNLHLPVIGGASAGKSSFLMASMVELERRQGQLKLSFPDPKHQALFEKCDRAFASGTTVDKTAVIDPNAFLVDIAGPTGDRRAVYVYDAAGEMFQDWESLRGHGYYSYIHGLLFLIDPFSLPPVRADRAGQLAAFHASADDPQDVYSRVIGNLRTFKQKKASLTYPCAVVLTKADGLEDSLTDSAAVREWLMGHGGDNLVRSLEHDFRQVTYFACSALGRQPDSSSAPFVPRGVVEPLGHMLAHYGLNLRATPTAWTRLRQGVAGLLSGTSLGGGSLHNQAVGILAILIGLIAPFLDFPRCLVPLAASLLLGLAAFRRAQLRLGQGAWAAVLCLALLGLESSGMAWSAARERARQEEAATLTHQADTELAVGQLDQAESHYRQVVALIPSHPQAQAGLSLVEQKRWDELLEKARQAYREKAYDRARQLFTEALKKRPGNPEARAGLKLARQTDPESSLRAYFEAINGNDLAEAHSFLSRAERSSFPLDKFASNWSGSRPQLLNFKLLNQTAAQALVLDRVQTAKGTFRAKFSMVYEDQGWHVGKTVWLKAANPVATRSGRPVPAGRDGAPAMLTLYYQRLNARRYEQAYAMRSSRSRGSTSYSTFCETWSNNRSVNLEQCQMESVTATQAEAAIRLVAVDTDRQTGEVKTTAYRGKIRLVWEGEWRYDGGDFTPESTSQAPPGCILAQSGFQLSSPPRTVHTVRVERSDGA